MPFHRLYFNLIRLLYSAKPAVTNPQKLTFILTYEVIIDLKIKVCNIFGKFKPGSIKCRFPIENMSSSLADSRGGGRNAPSPPPHPPISGQGPALAMPHRGADYDSVIVMNLTILYDRTLCITSYVEIAT